MKSPRPAASHSCHSPAEPPRRCTRRPASAGPDFRVTAASTPVGAPSGRVRFPDDLSRLPRGRGWFRGGQ
jgi:hypothetical protein